MADITPHLRIPYTIFLDKKLTSNERIVLAEIASLSTIYKNVAVNNAYFKRLGIAERSASRIIKSLDEKGYIKADLIDHKKRLIAITKKTKNLFNGIKKYKNGKELPNDVKVDWFDDYLKEYDKKGD